MQCRHVLSMTSRHASAGRRVSRGANPGDYSRGAGGFWIENGELAYPVEEITIAGNLKHMFRDIEVIGSDLVFRGRIASPTVKIAEMMVAGN